MAVDLSTARAPDASVVKLQLPELHRRPSAANPREKVVDWFHLAAAPGAKRMLGKSGPMARYAADGWPEAAILTAGACREQRVFDCKQCSPGEPTRRDFLYVATATAGAVGAAATLIPLIDQMNPDASTIAAGGPMCSCGRRLRSGV
jgi:Ubiquitinol-cytochrome C reductase Fe-S subunit TAT signal